MLSRLSSDMNQAIALRNIAPQSTQRALMASLCVLGLALLIGTWIATGSAVYAILAVVLELGAVLVWAYPKQAIALLVGSLFLESEMFSITLPFGRVRLFHLIGIVLAARAAYDLITKKVALRRTPLDVPLLAFLFVNAGTVLIAPDFQYSLKILGLTVLLAVLYWTIIHFVRTRSDIERVTKWFIAFGLIQVLIGIGQIALVYLDSTYGPLGINIPVFHSNILPFGRPYGTFVEPDWFGALCGALLAIVIVRAFNAKEKNQLNWLLLAAIVGSAFVLSGVRGAWIGAVVAAVMVLFINRKYQWLDLRVLPALFTGLLVISILFAMLFPELTVSLVERLFSLTSPSAIGDEPRVQIVTQGIEIWKTAPWFGHGPGGFAALGSVPSLSEAQSQVQGLIPFQTNMLVNILIDVGVAGMAIALWFGKTLVSLIRKSLHVVDQRLAIIVVGFVAAITSLFVTYQVTTGAWLAMSWFLLAMTVSACLIPLEERS